MSTVNHMSHSRTGTASEGYRYSIAPINSNYQVHYALASPWARDPEYVRGIIRSYVEQKRLRGKTSQEVGTKLNLLEKELPSFLPSFCDVREQYSLPPSPWVRRPRLDFASPSSGSGPSRRVSSATTSRYNIANPSLAHFEGFGGGGGGGMSPLTRTTTAPGRQQSADRRNNGNRLSGAGGAVDDSALPAEFRVRRQNTEDRDEPPPPPYARQDPEPDSTRLLAERLAAEHGDGIPLNPPEADSSIPDNEQAQDDRSPARPTSRPTPPRPDHASRPSSHSTPNQNHNQNRNPTPPMPGSYAAPLSPPPRAASSTSAHAQGGSPDDSDRRLELARSDSEQLRMAYEESQLEEAKRESMAAEREREEMERAIQMSLEAEEAETMERVRRESGNGNASASGSGSGAGGYGQGPVGFIQPPQAGHANHYSQVPGSNQATAANGPSASSFDPFGDVGQLEGQMQQTSLLDGDDEDRFLAIPPMHTGQGRAGQHAGPNGMTPPAISPRLGSKNPFLSPHDSAKPLPRPPSQSQQRPQPHSSASSSRLVYQVPYTSSNPASGSANGHTGSQNLPQSSPGLPPASPGYQAVSNPARASSAQQGSEAEGGRAVVIVDDGAHVQGFDKAQEIVQGLITQAKLDVYFVNSKRVGKDIEAVEDVQDLFGGLAPRGSASVGARLDYLLHEHNIIIITDGTCARPIAKRAKQLRINPSLTSEQLLSGEPADDLEKVLETRVGRVHFVQVGDDEEGRKGLQVLASQGMGMDVYTALSEEFVQSALYS